MTDFFMSGFFPSGPSQLLKIDILAWRSSSEPCLAIPGRAIYNRLPRICCYRAFAGALTKIIAIFAVYLAASIVEACAIFVAHSVPSNIQKLYDAVKHGGCKNFVDNNHNLGDGHSNTGEALTLAR